MLSSMRLLRLLTIALLVAAILMLLGHVSGNQPRRDALAAAEKELGIQLESQRVDLGNVTLHVVLAGPEGGPPVILLHGFPEFWYAWVGQIGRLAAAGFRVIVPDQRGYNDSDEPEQRPGRHESDPHRILLAVSNSRRVRRNGIWSGWHAKNREEPRQELALFGRSGRK